MDKKRIDMIGLRFNRWEVKEFSHLKNRRAYWICECDCGNIVSVDGAELRRGGSKSCGCYNKDSLKERFTIHGLTHSPTHSSYVAMKRRFEDKKHRFYKHYGGRGITICDEWMGADGFINFLKDMGLRPKNTTIDRKDVNGNYCKDNCRWATLSEQANNRRSNVFIEYRGEIKTTSQWAVEYNLSPSVVIGRIRMGWDMEKSLTVPVRPYISTKGA